MGRSPCCDETGLKKGPWTPEEDQKLVKYIQKHGHGSWRALPRLAGLNRCGKSCRLRWTNYLRPDIKRGKFSQEEEQTILNLHAVLGNKWSAIASHLPGRTDNEIKNFWNTHLKKKLIQMGFDPMTHRPRTDIFSSLPHLLALANLKELMDHPSWEEQAARLQAEAAQMARLQYYLQFLFQPPAGPPSINNNGNTPPSIDMETINFLNSISSNSINKDGSGSGSGSDPVRFGLVGFETSTGSTSIGGGANNSSNLNCDHLQSFAHDSAPFSHLPDLLQVTAGAAAAGAATTSPDQMPPVAMNKNNSNELTALMISQGSEESLNSSSVWFGSPSPSPTCLPTRNSSISSLVDASNYGDEHVPPSLWPDILLEDSLFHEMA